jgi:hypothetical protein
MIDKFFAYARERYRIRLKRNAGEPKPWTQDPLLRQFSFTEVFREDDRTTVWLRENVREPLRDSPRVLPAVLIFRWFNRIETGEAIFLNKRRGISAFDRFMHTSDIEPMRKAIIAHCGPTGPFVTGAYTINTISAGPNLNKMEGVLKLIEMWFDAKNWKRPDTSSLQAFCEWCKSPCLAGFMVEQVACDLRHTYLLENAPDIMTWTNPGPGCIMGLNRVFGRPVETKLPDSQLIYEMRGLLALSQQPEFWPAEWPKWELHEVENICCELNKYQRGYSRRKYDGGAS